MRRSTQAPLSVWVVAGLVAGCGSDPTEGDLAAVQYAPEPIDATALSTPHERGSDPEAVAEVYWLASQLENSCSPLVGKGGLGRGGNFTVGNSYDDTAYDHQSTSCTSSMRRPRCLVGPRRCVRARRPRTARAGRPPTPQLTRAISALTPGSSHMSAAA